MMIAFKLHTGAFPLGNGVLGSVISGSVVFSHYQDAMDQAGGSILHLGFHKAFQHRRDEARLAPKTAT
jgi:hypothetical protein